MYLFIWKLFITTLFYIYIYLFIWWHVILFIVVRNKFVLASSSEAEVIHDWKRVQMKMEVMMIVCRQHRWRDEIQETFFLVLFSWHLLLYNYFHNSSEGHMIGTSAKRTDWNVGGKLFEEVTLFSDCKHYCIISAWKTRHSRCHLYSFSPNSVKISGTTVISRYNRNKAVTKCWETLTEMFPQAVYSIVCLSNHKRYQLYKLRNKPWKDDS